jgi:hypothetical protein
MSSSAYGGAPSGGAGAGPASQRPQALVAVIARPALPQAPSMTAGGRGAAADLMSAK